MHSTFMHVYVLHDGGNEYYVGASTVVENRLKNHKNSRGAKVTKDWCARGVIPIVYWIIELKNACTYDLFIFEKLVADRLKQLNPACKINGQFAAESFQSRIKITS